MQTVRWGIIGAGNIAHRFTKSLQQTSNGKLTAISGRNNEKMQTFAASYDVDKIYLSHEELINDPEIDAIYIALPHFLHFPYIQKCLKAHKPVLCEKPAVLTGKEAEEICKLAKEENVLFMEALKSRFLSCYQEVKKMHRTMGKLTHIELVNTFEFPKEKYNQTYITRSDQGGGILWDSGCYLLSFMLDFVKGDVVIDDVKRTLVNGVDGRVECSMHVDDVDVSLKASLLESEGQNAVMTYENGEIRVPLPHRPSEFTVTKDSHTSTFSFPYIIDDFYAQIVHFMNLLKEGKKESDIMSLDTTVQIAQLFDAIRSYY